MGTKMGLRYACLFVGYVEEKMRLSNPRTKPIILGRYIGISTPTENELENFIQYVNDFHPSSYWCQLPCNFYLHDQTWTND